MTRHPVLRPGDMLRLGGEMHTVAGLDGATVRLADVTGAVMEVTTTGLLADPGLELVTPSRVPLAPQPVLDPPAGGDGGQCALVGVASDRGDHRSAARQPAGHPAPPGI